jgi:hypothetical protein
MALSPRTLVTLCVDDWLGLVASERGCSSRYGIPGLQVLPLWVVPLVDGGSVVTWTLMRLEQSHRARC